MKKALSLLLSVVMSLVSCLALASCKHECKFLSDWQSDGESHWHACVNTRCKETSDKSKHEWNKGKVTREATSKVPGLITYTCTTCSATKKEEVEFAGLTRDEWYDALSADSFEKFTYREDVTLDSQGMSMEVYSIYVFTENSVRVTASVAGESETTYFTDINKVLELRSDLIDSTAAMASYHLYDYDTATGTYKANNDVYIDSLGASTRDVTLIFEGGKLVEIVYSINFTQGGKRFSASSVVTITYQ